MNIPVFFDKAVKLGIENDPRGKNAVMETLDDKKKNYEQLRDKDKQYFDEDALINPYSDSRILFYGKLDKEIKTILVGIDIGVSELLLADRLSSIDMVLAHHPEGAAYAMLYDVMRIQSDILYKYGVPINIAESLMDKKIEEIQRKLMPINHSRAVDAARLLNIPLMCIHTPADNMVTAYLEKLFDEKKPRCLDDIIDLLLEHDEYKDAAKNGAGPSILNGSKSHKAGKIFVDMTGGTEGSEEIYKSFSASGINTIVGMHMSEEHKKIACDYHINIIIAGHISSDNLGLNLLLDRIILNDDIKIIECSGFRRFKRDV
ncbi:NGG1p interacting factor 3, NIF3 [Candidatus Magnetoovum chiemensis]|nr:NGG1p interacting factor 3, NIF3 [Candidatus Magnetoovum chiemensis]